MRENKQKLTLTQRSLGAIPVSERRRAAEMLKKVRVAVIAATVLVASAVADVTLEGSG